MKEGGREGRGGGQCYRFVIPSPFSPRVFIFPLKNFPKLADWDTYVHTHTHTHTHTYSTCTHTQLRYVALRGGRKGGREGINRTFTVSHSSIVTVR